jgi:hypothetical protein
MNIKIGILGEQAGWQVLLQQIGAPFAAVGDSLLPEEFSVVVASDDVDDRESEMLRQYLTLGGGVLCSVKVYARLRQTTSQYVNINYFYPTQNSTFHSIGIIDVNLRCQLAWNANELKTDRGGLAAHIGMHSSEYLIALPFDPSLAVLDRRSAVKSFYSPERRIPFENVSQISKGEIRAIVTQCLEILHHRRKLPFVHLWHFPNGSRSVFCFRIDTDQGTDEHLINLSKVIDRNGIPATWFVDVKSHQDSMKLFKLLGRQEIGVHCYEHEVFSEYKKNMENIGKAKTILQNSKLDVKGFAAPFGSWTDVLGRAIADSGFEYSSEFSYDYDNFPSVPRLGRRDGVLQIPIHPICIGSMKRHGYSDKQMIRYFAEVIQRKLAVREPLFFYHHPNDGRHNVLDWLFQEMRRERVPAKTMIDYVRWWKMRTASIPEFRFTKGSIYLRGVQKEKSLYVRIAQPDGTEAIIPASRQIVLDTVKWSAKPAAWAMPDDYLRARRFNLRVPLVRGLDAVTYVFRKKKR